MFHLVIPNTVAMSSTIITFAVHYLGRMFIVSNCVFAFFIKYFPDNILGCPKPNHTTLLPVAMPPCRRQGLIAMLVHLQSNRHKLNLRAQRSSSFWINDMSLTAAHKRLYSMGYLEAKLRCFPSLNHLDNHFVKCQTEVITFFFFCLSITDEKHQYLPVCQVCLCGQEESRSKQITHYWA